MQNLFPLKTSDIHLKNMYDFNIRSDSAGWVVTLAQEKAIQKCFYLLATVPEKSEQINQEEKELLEADFLILLNLFIAHNYNF